MNHKTSENGGMGAQTIMLTDQALHNHNLSNDPLLSQQLANEVRLRNFAVAAAAAATGVGATGNWSAPNMGGTNSGAGGGCERQGLVTNTGGGGEGSIGMNHNTGYLGSNSAADGEGASDDTGTINSDQLNTSLPPAGAPPSSMRPNISSTPRNGGGEGGSGGSPTSLTTGQRLDINSDVNDEDDESEENSGTHIGSKFWMVK